MSQQFYLQDENAKQKMTIDDLRYRLKDLSERYSWLQEENTNLSLEVKNLTRCIEILKRRSNLKYRTNIGELGLL